MTEQAVTLETLGKAEPVPDFGIAGVRGWTTTVENGSFGLGSAEPVGDVMGRWAALLDDLEIIGVSRLASATQVHGAAVSEHGTGWSGWLRQRGVDGHVTSVAGTALAVTVADCTPVFVAHERAIALLHAGWRGTAAGILHAGLDALARLGCPARECSVHLGPSICGSCYEVGPEVITAVTGKPAVAKGYLDVRSVLAEQGEALGVNSVTTSPWCTKCGNGRFYSHRRGDTGRSIGVMTLL